MRRRSRRVVKEQQTASAHCLTSRHRRAPPDQQRLSSLRRPDGGRTRGDTTGGRGRQLSSMRDADQTPRADLPRQTPVESTRPCRKRPTARWCSSPCGLRPAGHRPRTPTDPAAHRQARTTANVLSDGSPLFQPQRRFLDERRIRQNCDDTHGLRTAIDAKIATATIKLSARLGYWRNSSQGSYGRSRERSRSSTSGPPASSTNSWEAVNAVQPGMTQDVLVFFQPQCICLLAVELVLAGQSEGSPTRERSIGPNGYRPAKL